MKSLLFGLALLATSFVDRAADRQALLAADSALALDGAAFTDSALYLHPGSPLVRGASHITTFLADARVARSLRREPVFADVSVDGSLGYTWGWTRSEGTRGKYLACWRKDANRWRLAAFVGTIPVTDSTFARVTGKRDTSTPVRGRASGRELFMADSAFAAMSVARGAKQAFLTFAAEYAMSFGSGPQMTEGRQAIGATFDAFPTGAVLEWWPIAAEIASSGDLGCTVGEAKINSLHHYSKYLTIWKRQPDKTWKFVADGGNQRPSPALEH
jgi:ketosteroid isomerase-like protein